MYTIKFWKSWNKANQSFLMMLSLLLILSIGFFWYSYALSPSPIITWDNYQELQTEEITTRSFQVGLQTIPVLTDNFMIFESQAGSPLQPNLLASYLFISILFTALIVILTIISTLKRFWFLIGMGLFCLFIISLQLEALEIFGFINKIPAGIIIVLVAAFAYYFHAFNINASFFIRLISFSILFVLLGIGIEFFSQVQNPILYLSVTGYSIGFLVTLIFILMVGAEIPAVFINVLTQGTKQTKTLRHFLIITTIYFTNLILAYSIKIGYLELNIWVINFFFLFTISALLGIWGFRQREPQYETILPADPFGVYLIIAMASVSFTTIGYFFATINDPVLEVIRDVIMYSHLGYGIIFFAYVLANFGSMLMQNLQVYKVLYKPNTMPYFTFRLMGLICTIAFLVYDTSYKSVANQVYSAFYNGQGDLYYAQGVDQLAEGFYNKSVSFRNQNHHAHYALASIQASRNEPQKEREELAKAAEGTPSEFSFINLSNAYQRNGNSLQAADVLALAKSKFPKSGAIDNALGLAFLKLKMADSALLSFQKASKHKDTKNIAETNLLGASAKLKINYPADSLLQLIGSDKPGPRANALALANAQNLSIQIQFDLGTDTTFVASKATYLCNYLINQREMVDTTLLSNVILLARRPGNDYFKEVILVAASHAYYTQGSVRKAFDLTREIAYSSGRGKYFNLLGTWALEQENPQIAANYFEIAKGKNISHSLFQEALANTEADSIAKALTLWDSVQQSVDTTQANFAKRIITVLKSSATQTLTLSDKDKYNYCRYKILYSDTTSFWKIVSSIKDEELKARAILDLSKKWYQRDEAQISFEIIKRVKGLKLTNKNTYNQILLLNMMLLAELDPENFKSQQLDKALPFQGAYPNELLYLKALQDEQTGNTEAAKLKFEFLSTANIHFEAGLIASAKFFSSDTTDRLKSYSIIVSGILARPNSIKLLKAYVKEAALIGFDDEANESLEKLKRLLSPRAFNTYVAENPDFFDIER
ncbi:MAG: hypothetical protein JNM78_00100 [Cyclobacteriaceae bacterium]|nr:hypothetical protein [Cyclobacteriaceae bacterium]